jgi:hypothetical protein
VQNPRPDLMRVRRCTGARGRCESRPAVPDTLGSWLAVGSRQDGTNCTIWERIKASDPSQTHCCPRQS